MDSGMVYLGTEERGGRVESGVGVVDVTFEEEERGRG